jgi:hypothetical protein
MYLILKISNLYVFCVCKIECQDVSFESRSNSNFQSYFSFWHFSSTKKRKIEVLVLEAVQLTARLGHERVKKVSFINSSGAESPEDTSDVRRLKAVHVVVQDYLLSLSEKVWMTNASLTNRPMKNEKQRILKFLEMLTLKHQNFMKFYSKSSFSIFKPDGVSEFHWAERLQVVESNAGKAVIQIRIVIANCRKRPKKIGDFLAIATLGNILNKMWNGIIEVLMLQVRSCKPR